MTRPSDWSVVGYAGDPTPGDPVVVRDGGQRYTQVADAINRCVATLRNLEAGACQSQAVEALMGTKKDILDGLGKAEGRYRNAGEALTSYSTVLEQVQRDTAAALSVAQSAKIDLDDANSRQARYQELANDTTDAADTEQRERYQKLSTQGGSDAQTASSQIASQKTLIEQAVVTRDTAARDAITKIQNATEADGLNDGWWENWGSKITHLLTKLAEIVATVAGILALVFAFIPVIGQALAAVLLVVAARALLHAVLHPIQTLKSIAAAVRNGVRRRPHITDAEAASTMRPYDNPRHGEGIQPCWDDPINHARDADYSNGAHMFEDPAAPYGRGPDGQPLSKQDWQNQYIVRNPDGTVSVNWPPNNGFKPGTEQTFSSMEDFVAQYGDCLDRIGHPRGSYFAVAPDGVPIPFEMRAMDPRVRVQPHYSYNLGAMPEGWQIKAGEIAPALGGRGGGVQVQFLDPDGNVLSAQDLVENGVLQTWQALN